MNRLTNQQTVRLTHALRVAEEQFERNAQLIEHEGEEGGLDPRAARDLRETFVSYATESRQLIELIEAADAVHLDGGAV